MARSNLILTTLHCSATFQRVLYIQRVQQYQQQHAEIKRIDPESWQNGGTAIEALVAAMHNGL
jgi:hypothetical protein